MRVHVNCVVSQVLWCCRRNCGEVLSPEASEKHKVRPRGSRLARVDHVFPGRQFKNGVVQDQSMRYLFSCKEVINWKHWKGPST